MCVSKTLTLTVYSNCPRGVDTGVVPMHPCFNFNTYS